MVKMHPVFQPNQVLTADHLNQVVDFLDAEDRGTRTRLLGVGVACGFELRSDLAARVVVSKGCGVTSEGDLAVFADDVAFTHCRPFSAGDYAPLKNKNNLVELLTAADPLDNTVKLISQRLADEPTFLSDRVALLFVERKQKATRSCLEEDCDEKGAREETTPRVLLLRRGDADGLVIWNQAPLLDERTSAAFPPSGLFAVERPSLAGLATAGYAALGQRYLVAVNASLPGLGAALATAISRYAPLLGVPAPAVAPPQALAAARDAVVSRSLAGVQVLHDWLSDLAAGLGELWEALGKLGALCCPPDTLFPRHLLLGRLENNLAAGFRPARVPPAPDRYRFDFYPAPAVTGEDGAHARAAALLQRLVLQLQSFAPDEPGRVVITPDAGPSARLGERSAPYYYSLRGSPTPLLAHWSPESSRNGWEKDLFSFRATDYGSPVAREPLRYQHARYPFLRVEGHAGLGVDRVLGDLRTLREQRGLPFRVVALSLDANAGGLKGDDDCRSADLERGYALLRAEYLCALEREKAFFAALKAPPAETGTVKGDVVIDEEIKATLPGKAHVKILDTGEIIPIGPDDKLEANLPRGTYVMQVEAGDFVGDRLVVDVVPGADTEQDFFLHGGAAVGPAIRAARAAAAPGKEKAAAKSATKAAAAPQAAKANETSPYLQFLAQKDKRTVADYVLEYTGKDEAMIDFPAVAGSFEAAGKGHLVVTVALPAQILGLLAQAIRLLPDDVDRLDLAQLGRNADALKAAAAALASQLVTAASGKPLDPERTLLLQHALTVAGFCFVGPLTALFQASGASAAQRRAGLTFLGFLAEHPGLEHLGGVPRGGTLVLAYEGGVVRADFALPYLCCDPCGAVVLRGSDGPEPPPEIHDTLTEMAPAKDIAVPAAADGAFVLRSIVTDGGALATLTVQDPKGPIHIVGQPKLFEQRSFSFEYLLEEAATKKAVVGKVFLDIVGDKPPPKPDDETVSVLSATAAVVLRPTGALAAQVTIASAKVEDPKDGTADVVENGKAIQFAPGAGFRTDQRAVVLYKLVRQGSATTVAGKITVLLEKIPKPGGDLFIRIPKPGEEKAVAVSWLKDKSWVIERIEQNVRLGDEALGTVKVDADKGQIVFASKEAGAFAAKASEVSYVAVNTQTGERVQGKVVFQFGKAATVAPK